MHFSKCNTVRAVETTISGCLYFFMSRLTENDGSGGGGDTNKGVTENHGSVNHETAIQ